MAEKFSLKDHLFNPDSVGQLAAEYASALPGFDAALFVREALSGFASRELLARLDWMADCLEPQLAGDFPTMADQLEAAMPLPLDPSLKDDDFGRFIHALPGILAVRHGLEDHRDRALDLLHAATQRFSMEFYIRPFINRWPAETLARLGQWVEDDNYHVRRLVSEGTRPRLPWAKAVSLDPGQTLPLLDQLHADPTRYVTRSVANHLNDIAKKDPDLVLAQLQGWQRAARQTPKELDWMTRHALRVLVRQGHPGALAQLGYSPVLKLDAELVVPTNPVQIGDMLSFEGHLLSKSAAPVLVDYRIAFARPGGKSSEKVFKLKQARLTAGKPLVLKKNHRLKGDATTFQLYPGQHRIILQVNGADVAEAAFDLV